LKCGVNSRMSFPNDTQSTVNLPGRHGSGFSPGSLGF
jgi:hypothetical protein